MSETEQSGQWTVVDTQRGNDRPVDSRSEAEEKKQDMIALGAKPEHVKILPPGQAITDESPTEDKDSTTQSAEDMVEPKAAEPTNELAPKEAVTLPETPGVDQDPLDILPSYMITTVDGKPSLNKRGVSVLAYHYDISVVEKETVAYPHETDYESAIVEIEVEGQDGRRFVGAGEAHADETPKHQLLRMAETRAYKRAVIFATGTGIVGYQELMKSLQ